MLSGRAYLYRAAGSPAEIAARSIQELVAASEDPKAVLAHFVDGLASDPEFAEEPDVAYRVGRLLGHRPESKPRGVVALALAGLLGTGLVASQCGALHPGALWTGVLACSVLVGWVGLRPFRPARH